MQVGDTAYASATATLSIKESTYNTLLAAYEKLGETANAALERLVETMRTAETALKAIEDNFSDNIEAELTAKATEIETAMNEAKDGYFAKFEDAHKDDFLSIEASLKAQKEAMKADAQA